MAAGLYNILIEQGATFIRTLVWRDSDGNLIDVTGFTARMQIRSKQSSSTVILEVTSDDYITVGDTDGEIYIEIPASVTEDLDFTRAVYDLEMISSGGIVTRLIQGDITLSKEVTR